MNQKKKKKKRKRKKKRKEKKNTTHVYYYNRSSCQWVDLSVSRLVHESSCQLVELSVVELSESRVVLIPFGIAREVGHASATFEFSPNFSLVYIDFCQYFFSRSERLTYYVLEYDDFNPGILNPSRSKLRLNPTRNADIFALNVETYFHYVSRKTPCRVFHIEWLCRKNAGNVNRPPYRYTRVTHWACPASSGIAIVLFLFFVFFNQRRKSPNHIDWVYFGHVIVKSTQFDQNWVLFFKNGMLMGAGEIGGKMV